MRRWRLSGGRASVVGFAILALLLGGLVLLGFDMLIWRAGPKYMRSDCLVRVDLEYVQESWIEESTVRLLITGIDGRRYREAVPSGVHFHMNLLGLVDEPPSIRFAYSKACEERFAMTQLLIDEFEHNYPGLVRFTISRDRLDPRFKGSCFSGHNWIDKDC
ncbi:hypothetical protein [Pelagibius sp.]|uniref:hypothetical protein n=1 Tax=Pelagibius sp. TaxID=1931238 RepID=UPI0026303B29|nr:hypothetical protein [Pelagibius sp.]